jgi:hypothetical protein
MEIEVKVKVYLTEENFEKDHNGDIDELSETVALYANQYERFTVEPVYTENEK